MREYFAVDEADLEPCPVQTPKEPIQRVMLRPTASLSEGLAEDLEGPDRLEEMERELRQKYDHIGVAASIAERYAQRMREFQRAGNEPRAAAAFRLAIEWMETYAGWATSGGEGEALSEERDRFHSALVREFGYDASAGEE